MEAMRTLAEYPLKLETKLNTTFTSSQCKWQNFSKSTRCCLSTNKTKIFASKILSISLFVVQNMLSVRVEYLIPFQSWTKYSWVLPQHCTAVWKSYQNCQTTGKTCMFTARFENLQRKLWTILSAFVIMLQVSQIFTEPQIANVIAPLDWIQFQPCRTVASNCGGLFLNLLSNRSIPLFTRLGILK